MKRIDFSPEAEQLFTELDATKSATRENAAEALQLKMHQLFPAVGAKDGSQKRSMICFAVPAKVLETLLMRMGFGERYLRENVDLLMKQQEI